MESGHAEVAALITDHLNKTGARNKKGNEKERRGVCKKVAIILISSLFHVKLYCILYLIVFSLAHLVKRLKNYPQLFNSKLRFWSKGKKNSSADRSVYLANRTIGHITTKELTWI